MRTIHLFDSYYEELRAFGFGRIGRIPAYFLARGFVRDFGRALRQIAHDQGLL